MKDDKSYERRIKTAIHRLQNNIHISKGQSKAIMINDCPFCDSYDICKMAIFDGQHGQIYQLCKIRSTELDRIWIDVSPRSRPEVNINDKFGMLTVEEYGGYDKYGNLLWHCRCECGKVKLIRGDNLIGNKTISCGCQSGISFSGIHSIVCEDKKFSYTVGSSRNPDGTMHKYPHENNSHVGCSVEYLVEHRDNDDPYNPEKNFRKYEKVLCDECRATVRYNAHSLKQCEKCGLIS